MDEIEIIHAPVKAQASVPLVPTRILQNPERPQSGALPANMVSILEDCYCPDTDDNTISVSAIVKNGAQKAGGKFKAGVDVPCLQQAVDQGIFNDDEKLTSVEDIDRLKDIPVPTEVKHMVPSLSQKSQRIPQRSNPSNSPITRTTKSGKVQKQVQPQGTKIRDLIRGMACQMGFDARKSDTIGMKVTPCTTQEDFVDPFRQDLESLFLEEDTVFTAFAIEDTRALVEDMSRQLSCLGIGIQVSDQGSQAEAPGSVEDSVLVENTSMSVEGKGYAGVITNQFGTVITVRDTIAVHELGGRDFGSPIKTIC